MKLTHKMITKRTRKKFLLLFLALCALIPVCYRAICLSESEGGVLLVIALFAFFLVFFVRGLVDYIRVKRGNYVVYKQECTSDFIVKDNSNEGIPADEKHLVFGNVGTYAPRLINKNTPILRIGDVYYLAVFLGRRNRIFAIFSADIYQIDADVYTTDDEHLYIPVNF